MTDSEINGLLIPLLDQLLFSKPLPWRIGGELENEVHHARTGILLARCDTPVRARMLIGFAEERVATLAGGSQRV